MLNFLELILLAFTNNVVFAFVSRSRNRNNMTYHAIASLISIFVWFATMDKLVNEGFTWNYAIAYSIGTVIGSVTGVKISMKIEKKFKITSDGDSIKSQ